MRRLVVIHLLTYPCISIVCLYYIVKSVQRLCENFEGERVVQQLWQIKLAQNYIQRVQCDHSPLLSRDFTDALYMRVRLALERAVKSSPQLAEEGLNDVLKTHLIESQSDLVDKLSRREAALVLLTLVLYDIPPPNVLKLTATSKTRN